MSWEQRLTGSSPSLTPRPRLYVRRRRGRRALLVAGVLALAATAFLRPGGAPAGSDDTAATSPEDTAAMQAAGNAPAVAAEAAPAEGAGAEGGAADAPAPQTEIFATFEDLSVWLPTAEPLVLGFHEAAIRGAQAMLPQGRLVDHQNTTRFDPAPDVDNGVDYVILASRGRPQPATSAADIMMRDDDPVLAPVTGEVVGVREYLLYGRHVDWRVEIKPDARPDLRVVLIHVEGVAVEPGDRVDAGATVLAGTANRFPFGSNIDRYTEPDRWPHVHLEVKEAADLREDPAELTGGEG